MDAWRGGVGLSVAQSLSFSLDGEEERKFMERLYQEFHLLIYNHACRYFSDQSQIDDLVQQTYLKLMKYLPKLRSLERNILPGYIVNVVKSLAIDELRKNQRARSINFSDLEEDFEEKFVDPKNLEADSWASIEIGQFVRVLLKLPESDQFILKAKYFLGWCDKDIAKTLGIKENALRVRLHRAKQKAIAIYKDEY